MYKGDLFQKFVDISRTNVFITRLLASLLSWLQNCDKLLSNKKRPTWSVSLLLDPTNIAKEFSTGFLLGELLNRHGLQEDFSMFSQNT